MIAAMEPDDLATVGARVRGTRKDRGLSMAKLAAAVDCAPSHMQRLELGQSEAGSSLLARIASVLDVSIDWILTGQESGEPPLPESTAPVLADFLDTELGAGSSASELEALRALARVEGVRLTVPWLQAMLLQIRSQITPEQANETAARMEAAEESLRRKGISPRRRRGKR